MPDGSGRRYDIMKKTTKAKVINHPTVSIEELKKNGKKVSKKTKATGVKQRVIAILKTNSKRGIALTQRQIGEALNNEVREQHINNIVRSLEQVGDIDRFEKSVMCDDGIRRDLMFNFWTGNSKK